MQKLAEARGAYEVTITRLRTTFGKKGWAQRVLFIQPWGDEPVCLCTVDTSVSSFLSFLGIGKEKSVKEEPGNRVFIPGIPVGCVSLAESLESSDIVEDIWFENYWWWYPPHWAVVKIK